MTDRIPTQIDSIATMRFLGCLVRFLLVFLAGLVVFALVIKQADERGTRAAAAFAFGGLVFGFAASILTRQARNLLLWTFVTFPLGVSLGLFAFRTLFGMSDELPLMVALAPLFLSGGFLIGQVSKR